MLCVMVLKLCFELGGVNEGGRCWIFYDIELRVSKDVKFLNGFFFLVCCILFEGVEILFFIFEMFDFEIVYLVGEERGKFFYSVNEFVDILFLRIKLYG